MALKNVTWYQVPNFCTPCYSSIFQDQKLSEEARKLLSPVWKAEESMRLEIANRINTLLYDRREPLMFGFTKELRVYWHHSSYRVRGVLCEVCYIRKEQRILKVELDNGSRVIRVDAMYALGVNEFIKLYEMIARTISPRDDCPCMV